jgi:hypothetical protein
VTLTKLATTIRIAVRWQTNACNTLEVERPQRAFDVRRTASEVIERVRQLARDHTDLQIAERLNQEGYRSGQGGTFSASQVDWLRYAYGIKSGCPLGPAACPTRANVVMVGIVHKPPPHCSMYPCTRLPIGARRANVIASKSRRVARGGSNSLRSTLRPCASPSGSISRAAPRRLEATVLPGACALAPGAFHRLGWSSRRRGGGGARPLCSCASRKRRKA